MSSSNNKHFFLNGGGEMGELIRAKDWSKTSLGTPDNWPQSLRTALSIILNSKFPMFLWWGPELICFYNDAYRPSLGKEGKHPSILGQKAEEAWPEIWPIIHPLIQQVLDGKGATWSENQLVPIYRNGKIEDVYWTFSYSPVYNESEQIAGVMVICNETTENVTTIKKLGESEHKIRALVENAPFAIAVYTGEEMIVELANESIINIWGKGSDVIGKSFMDILPELDNQFVFDQIKNVYKTGKAFHTENTPLDLIVNGKLGTYYFNYSFTPLYDLKGNIYGVMNTGIDLTDLNLAKQRIEEADKRFRDTVKQAPVGITILRGPEYIVEMANEAYLKLVDQKEASFVNRPLFDSLPEAKETVNTLLSNVLNTGIPYHGYEVPIPLKRYGNLGTFYFDFLYHPLKEEDGKISGIIVTVTEVTEKVESRKKIEQNEQRLSIIVEASELGIWELNVKSNELNYSKRYLKIVGGYSEYTELPYDQLINHIHPEDLPIRNKGVQEGMASGYLYYEARVIWNDQSIHWVEAKGKVFYDDQNNPERLLGTIRDITALKQYQQELEENEQKFRLLADSLPQHIWISDTEGNLNYYNQSVYSYSGLTPQQINEEGWLQIVHPDDREENIKTWMESINTGKNFLFEHRFKRYDGEYRWQLSRAIPQIDENGKIQMWVGTSTDIQEQKIFTNELEKQVKERTKELSLINESLEKSEERYHLMVEEVQDYAIFYLNHQGIVENWNRGAQKIKGYKADEIIGKHFSIFYTEADLKENIPQQLLSQAKEKGKAIHEGWRTRKDRSLFWANVVITAVRNKKKELIGFSKVTHDLTEKKKADDKLKLNALELQQKNTELEKMNKELQSFAYISSHDLQEPLRKIQTFASQIIERESQNLSENGKDKFKRMQNAAQRMQALINDLLSYSKTNIQEVKFEKTNLTLIIEEVKEDLREELEQKNAVIENEAICDDINIDIIPFQFRQLIYNLISNSIKFSNPDVPLHIKIRCEIGKGKAFNNDRLSAEKKYCHLGISDNGIGFEQEYGEKIFEVFQRLHGKSEYAGTGIGLAIVKKIVENHKGIITAKGELNKGAAFDVYIPVI